jgi:4-amino-4-deoxy-L-arabinose transferase-like glycosyltransferase
MTASPSAHAHPAKDHEDGDGSLRVNTEADPATRQPLYRRGWFLVVVAVAVAVLMRAPGLEVPVWNVDETVVAAIAAVTLDGGTPYRDWVDHRAPLTNLVYLIVFLLFGRYNMLAIHLVLLAMVAAMILLVYLLGRRLIGQAGAVVAALLFAVVSSAGFPASDLFALNTEWGLALSTMLGMYLLVIALTTRPALLVAAAAGAVFGAAVLFKQPAIFDLLAAAVFVLVVAWRPGGELAITSSRAALGRLVAMGLGALLVLGSLVVVVSAYGVWQEFVFYSFTYNTEYYAAPLSISGYLRNAAHAFLQAARPLGLGWLAVGGATLMLAGLIRPSVSQRPPRRPLQQLLLLWACGSFVGVAVSGRVFPHYFIQILAPWCLLAGFAVQKLASVFGEQMRKRLTPGVGRAISFLALAGAVLWFVFLPWRQVTPSRIARQAGWVSGPSTEAVAEHLRQVTPPDSEIFVWGFYPIPYVLSDRLPASRFLYCTFITGANVGGGVSAQERPVPGAMDELLEDLERNRPLYIVDTSPGGFFGWGRYPPERYPRLWAFIEAEYRRDHGYRSLYGEQSFRLYRRAADP